jgi:hypothetical protein
VGFACPSGNVFIGSIDTTWELNDAHYICNALGGYIKTIGIDNIVQICINNVSNMKSAVDLLIHHFPSFYFQGFATHCLDILLEDWGKATWAKRIVTKVKVVVSFIQQHHVPLAMFHCYETSLMLLNLAETWLAPNFLMVERLFKLKLAIEQIVTNLNWTTFVNFLCGSHHQKLFTKVRAIRTNIKRDEFLDTCANFVHMVELVLVSLRAFDGKQPCMGRVWLIMKTLERHVLSL